MRAPITTGRLIGLAAGIGLASGLVVLGVGGRLAMRALTVTLEAPSRFTLGGTLEVLAVGAGWGALTGPLWLLVRRWESRRRPGLVLGALVLGIALVPAGIAAAGAGPLVAPAAFVALAAVLFPAIFLLHGVVTDALLRRAAGPQAGDAVPTVSPGASSQANTRSAP